MVFFSTAIAALLVSQAAASREKIAGYEPGSQVTDHNALDMDQSVLQLELAKCTDEAHASALRVYQEGGHSKPIAQVTLSTGLASAVEAGTKVTGTAVDGSQTVGKMFADAPTGATEIEVQYQTSDSQSNYVNCQVGGLPAPNTDGCFAPTGTLTIEDLGSVAYTYDELTGNANGRTLQGFSTNAEALMNNCANCPYNTFNKVRTYYGASDYADQWVLAAFAGQPTNFANGNADFSLYDCDGIQEVIKKGTVYMHVYMYVIREMEDAFDDCEQGCIDCNADPVHAWDEAVAFYTGSLEGTDGSGTGVMIYDVADKRCANFNTCTGDDTASGTSMVNDKIFDHFNIGKRKLLQGQCAAVREDITAIENMMAVPLIQGTVRYAYMTSTEPYSEKAEAEGVVFAAAVLPLVHACSPDAAKTIHDNMQTGQRGSCDFAAVKSAFESVYDCMGVTCADVGGLYDSVTGTYQEGAEPCGGAGGGSGASSVSVSSLAGVVLAVVVALL